MVQMSWPMGGNSRSSGPVPPGSACPPSSGPPLKRSGAAAGFWSRNSMITESASSAHGDEVGPERFRRRLRSLPDDHRPFPGGDRSGHPREFRPGDDRADDARLSQSLTACGGFTCAAFGLFFLMPRRECTSPFCLCVSIHAWVLLHSELFCCTHWNISDRGYSIDFEQYRYPSGRSSGRLMTLTINRA